MEKEEGDGCLGGRPLFAFRCNRLCPTRFPESACTLLSRRSRDTHPTRPAGPCLRAPSARRTSRRKGPPERTSTRSRTGTAPPSCCHYEFTPFVGSDDPGIWLFNLIFGSSRIPSSAYQKWATKEYLRLLKRIEINNILLLRPI